MTALQWIVKEAKSIKKAYPNRFAKWTDYVKQASAIYASKHKDKSPVGKKKAVKKTAKKKLVKKVGVVKKRVLKKAAPKKTVKKVLKKHTHWGKVKTHTRRVNGVTKKPSEKDVLKSIQKAEKIQKSHMSMGSVKHEVIEKLMYNNKLISDYDRRILNLKNQIPKLDKVEKLIARDMIKAFKDIQRELKTHARELKKHI